MIRGMLRGGNRLQLEVVDVGMPVMFSILIFVMVCPRIILLTSIIDYMKITIKNTYESWKNDTSIVLLRLGNIHRAGTST